MPRIHLAIGEDHLRSTGKPRRDEVEIGSNGKSEHKMDDWGLGVPYFRKSPYIYKYKYIYIYTRRFLVTLFVFSAKWPLERGQLRKT